MSEHEEQMLVIQWSKMNEQYCPELELLHAIPSGGHRHKRVGQYMKAEGVKRGVPDLFLPVPRQGYHGMYIEMKMPKKRPTLEQREWLVALVEQGYRVELAVGSDMAIDALCSYLSLKRRFF
jgi:hypothetical protein